MRKWLMGGWMLAVMGSLTLGAADFNGDGRTDILWDKGGKGHVIWLMGPQGKEGIVKLPAVTASWSVVATGDYDGDGKSDILWRQASGKYTIWTMDEKGKQKVVKLGVNRSWTVAERPETFQPINQAMLRGKTFYFAQRESEWFNGEKQEYITYAKVVIKENSTLFIHGIVYDRSGNVVEDDEGTLPYRIENGKLVFSSFVEKATVTLIQRTPKIWYAVASYDKGFLGVGYDTSQMVQQLYLEKPKNFPEDL